MLFALQLVIYCRAILAKEAKTRIMLKPDEINKIIHAPIRLSLMTTLAITVEVDFNYLKEVTKTSDGNLNVHLSKLEDAGYIDVQKGYQGKKPRTVYTITKTGKQAFAKYINFIKRITEQIDGG